MVSTLIDKHWRNVEIAKKYKAGATVYTLSKEFNLSERSVYLIVAKFRG